VNCPQCARAIEISDSDLRAARQASALSPTPIALADADAAPLSAPTPGDATSGLLEAIVIDAGRLHAAAEGSHPGLTGQQSFGTNDAMIDFAMRGWRYVSSDDDSAGGQRRFVDRWLVATHHAPRVFWADLLAGFYFGGSIRNAIILMSSSVVLAVLTLVLSIGFFAFSVIITLITLVGLGFVLGQLLQFYLNVLLATAHGDEDISLVDDEQGFVEGMLIPMWRILLISGLYAFPAFLTAYYLPIGAENRTLLIGVAALLGTFFWPMALMLVWLGGSLTYMRPDRVGWAIWRVGPVYGLAWITVLITQGAWTLAFLTFERATGGSLLAAALVPFWLLTICFYFGYVLFRTLGVIYRHYGERLPWRLG
jgi:hypothetical protein